MNRDNFILDLGHGPVSAERIREIEEMLEIHFPQDYKDFIMPDQGVYCTPNEFLVEPESSFTFASGIGAFTHFIPGISGYVIDLMDWTDDRRPDYLVPFAIEGGGDLVCFNFSIPNSAGEPTIAYWSHEMTGENAVTHLANSFTEFMDMLDEDIIPE